MSLLTLYLEKRRNAIVKPYVNGNVLDIGCGPAYAARFLVKGQEYVGIELNTEVVSQLKRKYPRYEFYDRDLEKNRLALGKRKFDTILMIAVIEHLADPQNVILECKKYLKKNGRFIITTPTYFGNNIVLKLGTKIGLFSKETVKSHKIIYDFQSMKQILAPVGLRIVEYRRFEFCCNQLFIIKEKD
jgi:SAM-dependent methyltransferase